MTDLNDISHIKRELTKCIGTVFYVATHLPLDTPEHHPLWVASQRGMNLLEQLELVISHLEVSHGLH